MPMKQLGNIHHWPAYLALLCAFMAGNVSAQQKIYTRTDVRDLFPANTKNVWINNLRGRLDGIHLVDMIIGTDGHSCKGLYTLVQSGETFFFEGQEKEKQMQLVELNGDQRLSGFIFGKYDGKSFDGHWYNAAKKDSLSLKLSFTGSYGMDMPKAEPTTHWHRIYEGILEGKKRKIYLHRDGLRYDCMHYEDSQRHEQHTVGKGTRAEFLAFGFTNCALSGKWLSLDTSVLEKVDIIQPVNEGYEVVATFRQEAALEFTSYEYADYFSRLMCVRPVSGNKKFSAWMDNVLKDWIQNRITKMNEFGLETRGTKDRWVQSAEGWVEVDLFLENVISGTIYMQSSLDNHTDKIPFIYDLKTGQELTLNELFTEKGNGPDLLTQLIKEKVTEGDWGKSESEWVKKQDFKYCTLSEEGFCCRTEFNTIFGEKKVMVPYNTLLPFMKESGLIKAVTGR